MLSDQTATAVCIKMNEEKVMFSYRKCPSVRPSYRFAWADGVLLLLILFGSMHRHDLNPIASSAENLARVFAAVNYGGGGGAETRKKRPVKRNNFSAFYLLALLECLIDFFLHLTKSEKIKSCARAPSSSSFCGQDVMGILAKREKKLWGRRGVLY